MTYNSKTKQYVYQYKADKIKRVPLDVQMAFYDKIKAAADHAGESVNGYIKEAIRQRMERDGLLAGDPVQAAGADPRQAYPAGDIGGAAGGRVTTTNIPEKEKGNSTQAEIGNECMKTLAKVSGQVGVLKNLPGTKAVNVLAKDEQFKLLFEDAESDIVKSIWWLHKMYDIPIDGIDIKRKSETQWSASVEYDDPES